MMAAFAEPQRDMIRERTMAGLAAAHSQGRVGGHPSVMDVALCGAAQSQAPTRPSGWPRTSSINKSYESAMVLSSAQARVIAC